MLLYFIPTDKQQYVIQKQENENELGGASFKDVSPDI